MEKTNLVPFREAFEAAVKERILPEQLEPSMIYDTSIVFKEITPKLYRILQQMAPFGPQNMRPVFHTRGEYGRDQSCGKTTHLKLEVTDFSGVSFSELVLGWQHTSVKLKAKRVLNFFTLDENEYNGQKNLQLKVKALRFTQ